jgi:hypothetical protein
MGKPEISTGTNLQAKKSPLAKWLAGQCAIVAQEYEQMDYSLSFILASIPVARYHRTAIVKNQHPDHGSKPGYSRPELIDEGGHFLSLPYISFGK